MNEGYSNLYDGFKSLSFVARSTGLGIDQVNFLAATFTSIYISYFYRAHLSCKGISTTQRHAFQIIVGLILGYFCFGRQMGHLFAQSLMYFIFMKNISPNDYPKVGLLTSIGYLTMAHIYRQVYDYGNYTLDITGPLMLNTQRLSSLAFALKDSYDERTGKKLPEPLKIKAVSKFPSLLEFASFVLSFQSLLCGPVYFYKDYIHFVECKGHRHKTQTHSNGEAIKHNDINNNEKQQKHLNGFTKCNGESNKNYNNDEHFDKQYEDCHSRINCSLNNALQERLMTAVIFGLSFMFIIPMIPLSHITGSSFKDNGFWMKCWLLFLFTTLQRQKYYFAWKLGEASSINAGFGYNGVDHEGAERWDLALNVNVLKVEFSNSLKVLIDNWNISTATWLRYIIYERTKNVVHVFMFSAFWHGFYPGYYITFCTGGLFITAARLVRKVVRPHFQSSAALRKLYDAITFVFTRLALTYMAFPFLILELYPVYQIYKEIYFCMHIGAVLLIALMYTIIHLQNSHKKTHQQEHVETNKGEHHHQYHHHHHDKKSL